ncbi:MAG: ABC transporter ATP-binding protein [Planctomycetes bacterium]|nr:ABC transporter ATP-binding protein [Planctomycetota bacterium]
MIVAQNLSKSFGKVRAVDSINFSITAGRVVGFLGPNGAGKTTTIRMLAGFLPPSSGSVTVDGLDVRRRSLQVRRRIGYLPESTPLYGEMRVIEYLRFRASLFGVRRSKRRGAIDTVIRRCRLEDVRRRQIRHCSKGYRQRVGLAAAMLHDPPVLILDEPTAGLDPEQIREVRQLIRELAGRHTILLSTHILPEAELTCDDIMMIAAGRIRMQGSVNALRQSAAQGCRYIVETDGADAETALWGLPSVERVDVSTLGDGWTRLTITPKRDAEDRRELIGRTLREKGAAVRELKREAPTLEQMFVEVIAGGERTGGGASTDGPDSGHGASPPMSVRPPSNPQPRAPETVP